jgi:RND family efflux transporter MFP subunit
MKTMSDRSPAGGLAQLAGGPQPFPGDEARAPIPRPIYRWRTRVLLPAALLGVFGSLLAYAARGALLTATDVRVVPVVLQATQRAPAGGSVVAQATGWVEPDPYPIAASALTDGVVREVLVLEGDRVEAGQAVAQLVDEDAQLSLAAAEAELARAQASLSAAQEAWDNPVDRQEAVATSQARLAEAEAELSALGPLIEAEEARTQELATVLEQIEQAHRGGAATQTELITAQQQLASQRGRLEATKARRPVLEAQLARAAAGLAAAQENRRLRIEESGALAVAKAESMLAEARRDEARLRLERTTVRSPAAGVVMTRHVEIGAKVMQGSDMPLSATIVRLYDPRKLQVRADVPLADAAKVGVGMEAQVIVTVLPDRVFQGRVTRVVNEADVARNTLQVKVAIIDSDPQLKPEMLARVRFLAPVENVSSPGEATALATFIPESFVFQHGGGPAVLIVDRRANTAALRHVELGGGRRDGWVEIASGLAPGDQVIADTSIDDGQRIRVVGEAELEQGGDHGVH